MRAAEELVRAGRFAEAAKTLAAAIDALIGPGGHPYRGGEDRAVALEVAALSHQLGAVEWSLARFAAAEAALERARVLRETWGVPPALRADTIERQAALHHYLGRDAEAEGAFREALRLREAVGDPLAEAVTRRNRGAFLRDQGDVARARAELEIAAAAIARHAGDKSAEHVAALKAVAHLDGFDGPLWRAEESARRAAKLAVRVHGDGHPYVGGALLSWARADFALRRFDAAAQHLADAEAILAAGFGAEHPLVACALAERSRFAHEDLDYDAAEAHARRAAEIYARSYAGHPFAASFMEGHAVALTWLERDQEARAILEAALALVPARDPRWRAQRASLLRAVHLVCRRLGDDEAAWRWLGAVKPPPDADDVPDDGVADGVPDDIADGVPDDGVAADVPDDDGPRD